MDYLSIIAARLGSKENYDSNRIIPDGNLISPNLKYKNDIGEDIMISGLGGTSRIATVSDLLYLLEERFYNSEMTRFVRGVQIDQTSYEKLKIRFDPMISTSWEGSFAQTGDKNRPYEFPPATMKIPPGVCVISGLEDTTESSSHNISRVKVVDSNGNILLDESITAAQVEIEPGTKVSLAQLIEYQYNLIMKATEVSNLEESQGQSYQYNVKAIVDLLNETTVLDLIKLDSGSYTNIVDLTQLPRTKLGNISSIVKIGVQYSKRKKIKQENGIETTVIRVHSQDLSFSPFEKRVNEDTTEELIYKNFQEMINEDVALECTNGIVRVFPANQDIIECIISYCYVIYGKL